MNAIVFEKEKLEKGKEVLAPYLRGENPGKPKISYLQNSDAESSSDEDESSTYDQKKMVSIKISRNDAKFLMKLLKTVFETYSLIHSKES